MLGDKGPQPLKIVQVDQRDRRVASTFPGQSVRLGRVAIKDDDPGALGGQAPDDARADAFRPPVTRAERPAARE